MRVTIKNESNGDGGHSPTNGHNGKGKHSPGGDAPAEGSLRSSEIFQRIQESISDIREAFLQILSGALPYVPRIEVRERGDGILVMANLPDIDESSVHVAFEGNFIRVSGTKVRRRERGRRRYRRVVEVSRTFERVITLPGEVDRDHAVATLRKDVLRINVPKMAASLAAAKVVPVVMEPAE